MMRFISIHRWLKLAPVLSFVFSLGWSSMVTAVETPPVFLRSWGNEGVLNQVSDIAIDVDNNVYVADSGYARVVKFSPTGMVLAQWGGFGNTGDSLFSNWGDYGIGLGLDSAGSLYVADYTRLQKFTPNGEAVDISPGDNTQKALSFSSMADFSFLADVAVDAGGNRYVVDYAKHRVRKFSANGQLIANWGATNSSGQPVNGSGDGQFYSPSRIAVFGNFVYVSDSGNKRVQRFNLDGIPIANELSVS